MSKRIIKIEWHGRQSPPTEVSGNSTAHWQAKRRIKQSWQDETIINIYNQNVTLYEMPRATIQYTSYHVGEPENAMDEDNFIIGMKAIQDLMVHQGVFPDDSHRYVKGIQPVKYVRVSKMKDRKIIMEIIEV
jgi:hypothetical protein